MAHQVNVFISHSWTYSDHYETLANWIFNKAWESDGTRIYFSDTSVPKDDPIHNAPTASALYIEIAGLIAGSDVVVIPMGMYAEYSDWIQKEIDASQLLAKPILAVNPWGQERSSSTVRDASHEAVGWQSQSVIDGIWRLYLGGR